MSDKRTKRIIRVQPFVKCIGERGGVSPPVS